MLTTKPPAPAPPPPSPPPPPPPPPAPPARDKLTGKRGLISQVTDVNRAYLHKTETKVTTEDGKKYVETHDGSGRYTTTLTNRDEIGFVPGVVMDFQVGEVLPGLILASQDVAAELPILEQYRVTHVLNVASRVDNFFQEKIKYTNLRIADHPYFNILQFFQEAFECIDEGRESGCVLVHCNAGRSRAATLAIGYLMKTEQLSLENAYAHVKEKRPSILPNEGFLAQLKVYEEQLGLAKNAESND